MFQDLVQALDKLHEVGDLLPPSHTEIVEINSVFLNQQRSTSTVLFQTSLPPVEFPRTFFYFHNWTIICQMA